jgi:hypothetical protein
LFLLYSWILSDIKINPFRKYLAGLRWVDLEPTGPGTGEYQGGILLLPFGVSLILGLIVWLVIYTLF